MSDENNFSFRLHPEKDRDVLNHVRDMKAKHFNARHIFTDAVRRNLGVTPELFNENQRSLTIGDMKGLLGETVDIIGDDIGKVLEAIQGYKAELEDFMLSQKELTRSLFEQVASGELSAEEATEEYQSEADAYALKLMKSLDDRYSE